jgi:uncharacterized protein YheU (UPF0270 family)
MEIPLSQLAPATLRGLVEEYITREGTDYGVEVEFERKVDQVLAQLRRGEATITFDPETETASVTARPE